MSPRTQKVAFLGGLASATTLAFSTVLGAMLAVTTATFVLLSGDSAKKDPRQ